MSPFADQLIAALRLSSMIGKSCLRHACEQAGLEVEMLQPMHLPMLLPQLEKNLKTFHEPVVLSQVMTVLEAYQRNQPIAI